MKLIEKLKGLSKYSYVVCFLALEVFAIIAFSLTNSIVLFGSFTLALAIILAIFSVKEMKEKGFSRAVLFIFPVVVYAILVCVGYHTRAHTMVHDYSIAEAVFIGIAMVSVALCGYFLSLHKAFNISHFLMVIFSALAILVFINLIVNMVNFAPFYTLTHKNYFMYYGGARSNVPVSDIAYTLEGFKFIESNISHYTLYPILLLSSSVVLFSLKFKDSKPKFLAYLLFLVLGLLALILVPSFYGLIYGVILAIIVGLVYLIKKFNKVYKPLKIVFYILLTLAGLVFLIMVLNTQSVTKGFADVISSNSLTNKLFNTNRIVKTYNPMIKDVFCSERFLGYYTNSEAIFYDTLAPFTNSILFDNFMTSGVIGTVILGLLIGIGFRAFKFYKVEDKKSFIEKNGLLIFAVIYLLYSLIAAEGNYAIFINLLRPTYMTAPFLLFIFILSFVFCSKEKITTKEEKHEEVQL